MHCECKPSRSIMEGCSLMNDVLNDIEVLFGNHWVSEAVLYVCGVCENVYSGVRDALRV